MMQTLINRVIAVRGYPKQLILSPIGNRRRVCDFLLVINNNIGSILYRFWTIYWPKIVNFPIIA